MQGFSIGDALMKILKDITGERNRIVIDELQALVRAGSVILWVYVHHMPLQLFIMKSEFHAETDKSPFQRLAAG